MHGMRYAHGIHGVHVRLDTKTLRRTGCRTRLDAVGAGKDVQPVGVLCGGRHLVGGGTRGGRGRTGVGAAEGGRGRQRVISGRTRGHVGGARGGTRGHVGRGTRGGAVVGAARRSPSGGEGGWDGTRAREEGTWGHVGTWGRAPRGGQWGGHSGARGHVGRTRGGGT